jgi:hypothetical protein
MKVKESLSLEISYQTNNNIKHALQKKGVKRDNCGTTLTGLPEIVPR